MPVGPSEQRARSEEALVGDRKRILRFRPEHQCRCLAHILDRKARTCFAAEEARDDILVLFAEHRAGRLDEPAMGRDLGCRSRKKRELELRQPF